MQPYQGYVLPVAPGSGVSGRRVVRRHDEATGGTDTWLELVDDNGDPVQVVPLTPPADDPPTGPDEEEVRLMLRDLAAGRRTATDVATWASQWVAADSTTITDTPVWEALIAMSGAGVQTAEGPLHDGDDYAAWNYAYDHARR